MTEHPEQHPETNGESSIQHVHADNTGIVSASVSDETSSFQQAKQEKTEGAILPSDSSPSDSSELRKKGGYPLKLKLLKRRVEMLDAVNKGFHLSAMIEQLAEKYHVSHKCLWNDWERREKWVPALLGLEKYTGFADSIELKLNAVQKAAWILYSQADNDNARVGALKVVLDSLEVHSDIVLSRDILMRLEHVEELAEKKVLEKHKL